MRNIEYSTASVGALRKNPWNTNKVEPGDEIKIRESLKRNGMFKPIIVREVEGVDGYEIVGGEHRWEQAIELGEAEVPIVNLGKIDEKKAKEIGLIDNARYGADDTLGLADLLKEIGDIPEIQSFLPYEAADINAIFSASDIALDDLELSEDLTDLDPAAEDEKPAAKAPKTHAIMRFKVTLADAERLTALISKTRKENSFTTEDDLTNAGDALVHLLSAQLSSPKTNDSDDQFELDLADLAALED